MKILVTGGAGFIGSHTVDALIAADHGVVVLDDLSSGKATHVHSAATFVEGSITDAQLIEQLFRDHRFEAVFHFAAQKSVTHSVEDPVGDASVNIIGSLQLLAAMQRHGVKQIIFSSTGGALYGDEATLPATEASPLDPLSPYAIAKRSTERYLNFYRRQGMKTQILRYANVYGPRQDPFGEAGVVAIFSQKLVAGEPLTVFGTGEQTRDFVFVADIVAANLKALAYPESGIWNIGTAQEVSIATIAEALVSLAATHSLAAQPIHHAAARSGELQRSALDATLAKEQLSWTPQTSIHAGLEQTLRSFIP